MNSNIGKRCSEFLVTFFAVFTLIAGLLIPTQIKAASYDKNQKGSIKINLNDVKVNGKVTNKKGVAVNIYQVAAANHDGVNLSFKIANSLESTGVNVNDITTSEKNLNAAKKLSNKVHTDQYKRTYKCVVKGTSDNKIQFQGHPQKNMNISNVFAEVPDKFLIVGELSIKKRVLDENGQETTTNDTFYASVYTQNGSGDNIERELIQTVQLQQNDTVTISVPINQNAATTNIYVEETDAEGNTIDPDNFDYTISGEGNVELSMDVTEESITLTNKIKGEESSEEETTSTEKETTKKSKKSRNGKTGDNTPIVKWIVIGAIAAVVIIFLVGRKKKSE